MRPGTSNHAGWLQAGIIRGNMLSKVLPGDEELGKKDDDYHTSPRAHKWAPTRTSPLRWRRRRILQCLVALAAVYFVFSTLSNWAQDQPLDLRGLYQSSIDDHTYHRPDVASDDEPVGPPSGTAPPKPGEVAPHTYSGLIKFYRLSSSLHGAAHTNGFQAVNRNVVFAISSLKSAATLLPVICEMSRWSRSWVHVAFMGRDNISVDQILEINGIDAIKCPAIWHDARPDYSEYSTDTRAESTTMAAIGHLQHFLHPQVIIIDHPLSEDGFFVRGVRAKTKAMGMTLVEGPENWENFMWTTRLDAGSLKGWHEPSVQIIVQVPPHSSSIIQLLKSLKAADYTGLRYPHLTIELPADVEDSVLHYLQDFRWPPNNEQNQISIRRRVTTERATQESSTIRLLELFYPASTSHSHALLLSPQVELSPQYYQYIMYQLLEYKYSAYGAVDSANVVGVSMELPTTLLDGESKLVLPNTKDMHTTRFEELYPDTPSVPFLWQAPNSHAALIFGDKWAEFHSFVSNRVVKHLQAPKAKPQNKVVSETLPSWTEYMLELMRLRGYALLYPGASTKERLVAVHNELYRTPEEFVEPPQQGDSEDTKQPVDSFLRAKASVVRRKDPEPALIPYSRPLHVALPLQADLPEIDQMPYLLHTGEQVPHMNVSVLAEKYAERYREVVGGCKIPEGLRRHVEPRSARDLFCFGDETDNDWERDTRPPTMSDAFDVVDDYEVELPSPVVAATPKTGEIGAKETTRTSAATAPADSPTPAV